MERTLKSAGGAQGECNCQDSTVIANLILFDWIWENTPYGILILIMYMAILHLISYLDTVDNTQQS